MKILREWNGLNISIVLAACIFVLAYVSQFFFANEVDSNTVIKKEEWKNGTYSTSTMPMDYGAPLPVECEEVPLYESERPDTKLDATDKDMDYFSEAYKNVQWKVNNLSSDAEANISIFMLINICRDNSQGVCGLVSPKLYKEHPIELLEKASSLGSSKAALMYALNAPSAAAEIIKRKRVSGHAQAKEIMIKAEKLGIEASRSKNIDALRYMSNSYQNGRFGEQDRVRALAFVLPLTYLGVQGDKERIKELKKSLNDEDLRKAENIAFGCIGNPDIGVLASPFD